MIQRAPKQQGWPPTSQASSPSTGTGRSLHCMLNTRPKSGQSSWILRIPDSWETWRNTQRAFGMALRMLPAYTVMVARCIRTENATAPMALAEYRAHLPQIRRLLFHPYDSPRQPHLYLQVIQVKESTPMLHSHRNRSSSVRTRLR